MSMPELKGEDIFYVIGFTNQDVLTGAHMHLMQRLIAPVAPRLVVKKLVEVYFVDPFVASDDDDFEQRYGNKYQTVYFYNETALALSNHFGIQVPLVIGKITRAELPHGFGTSIRHPSFTLP